MSEMENPALGGGAPEVADQAGASINPEFTPSLRKLQAHQISRRFHLSMPLALVIAHLVYEVGP
jgi:hypothetical protein